MDGDNFADRVIKRLHMFGQFFQGFVSPSKPQSPEIRADQHMYDDTGKYAGERTLEFSAGLNSPLSRDVQDSGTQPPDTDRRPFSRVIEPNDFFRSTRNLMEEFEQTVRIFDNFAFILQHPFHGHGSVGLPGIGIDRDPNDDTIIEEFDDDQNQDGRYFKFFGGFPNPSANTDGHILDESTSKGFPSSEENCRDLMLKPNPGKRSVKGGGSEPRGNSVLGRILDSFWETPDVDQLFVFPSTPGTGDNIQTGSYFSFSSQESSLQSDGTGISITATKVRETPEGREITTYKTNKDGVSEETKEFIPRKDLPPNAHNPMLGKIFRPRL